MPSRRTIALAAGLVLVVTAPLTACSSDEGASSDDPAPVKPADGPDLSTKDFEDATGVDEVEVQVRDNSYLEPYIEVSAGTTVVFDNVGRTQHDVYPSVDGAFEPIEPGDLEPDAAASLTFDEPGDYPYYCTLHGTKTKGMVGAIRVVE